MPKFVDVEEMKKRILCDDPEMPDYKTLMTFIDRLPEADVKPVVHAHWYGADQLYRCSACDRIGGGGKSRFRPPYCSYCGAKMDEGREKHNV